MASDELRILNLGAGNVILPGAVNHDRSQHRPEIDVVHDLDVLPWPWEGGTFDVIVARAVLEHLRMTLLESVGECYRIMAPGGRLVLKLPSWRHATSWLDPTHYWKFDLRTPEIFDPDTEYGQAYSFYGAGKWRIVKGPKLNRAGSSIHVTLEARK